MSEYLGIYRLVRKLAAGGMAEVFLAQAQWPMGIEKTLVLKRILPHLVEEPGFVDMFLSEARLASQLDHPHIVQIIEFGEDQGQYFLAMEYVDGPSLHVLIQRAQAKGIAVSPTLAARLVADACEALAFAHDFADPETGEPLGLVHRDISPDNILLSLQGTVKVADFGLAKAVGQRHRTKTGIIKGKLPYMAPEQVRAEPLDRRTDVYALGTVLYELLTGARPFEAPTDASLMRAILFEPPVPAVERRPELPKTLQDILDRALAREPERRYPDCARFQAALEEFIVAQGRPVAARQVARFIVRVCSQGSAPLSESISRKLPSRASRTVRRAGAAAALILLLLLLPAGGCMFWRMRRAASVASSDSAGSQPPQAKRPPPAPLPAPPSTGTRKGSEADSGPEVDDDSEVGDGTVVFRIQPYATVFLDGKLLGVTPLPDMEIPAGQHTVTLVNAALSKTVERKIQVQEGQSTIVTADLYRE